MQKNKSRQLKVLPYVFCAVALNLMTVLHTNSVYAEAVGVEKKPNAIPAPSASKTGAETPPVSDPALNPPAANAAPSADDASSGPGLFSGFLDPFDYDPRGRRDPFAQPVADVAMAPGSIHGPLLPLQTFDVSQLRVVGILWNVRNPKAMIKDPSGKLHIVGTNTKVGPRNGYIAVIREGELVVVETIEQDGRLVSSAQVVKIAK